MFEKFSVIDLIKTRSASVCTFAGNIVKFNVQTAQELHFPEYIQFLIEPKSKQFAIRACKEDAPNAVRFHAHLNHAVSCSYLSKLMRHACVCRMAYACMLLPAPCCCCMPY